MTKANVLDLWLWPLQSMQTAFKLAETLSSANAVIAARTPMIAAAFADPLNADTRELSRMVSEKSAAFGQSGRSLSAGQRTLHRAVTTNARDFGRLAGGDLLGPAIWWRMAERNLQFWSTFMALPGEALAPIHKRATGNARRLRR